MKPETVRVPRYLPDTAEVRQDLLDYYFEVQRFDRDLARDPEQVENVAGLAPYRDALRRLRGELDAWLRETGDPRMAGDDDRWDRFPFYGQSAK